VLFAFRQSERYVDWLLLGENNIGFDWISENHLIAPRTAPPAMAIAANVGQLSWLQLCRETTIAYAQIVNNGMTVGQTAS